MICVTRTYKIYPRKGHTMLCCSISHNGKTFIKFAFVKWRGIQSNDKFSTFLYSFCSKILMIICTPEVFTDERTNFYSVNFNNILRFSWLKPSFFFEYIVVRKESFMLNTFELAILNYCSCIIYPR